MLVLDHANDLTARNRGDFATSQWKTQGAFHGKPWMNGMIVTFGGNDTTQGRPATVR